MQQAKRPRIDQNTSGQIQPSGSFQTLNHGSFQIQYPSNWKVYGNNNSPVTIAPEAGVSQNAIAYGVVVSGYQPQGKQSLEQSATQVVEGLRQSNPQMQVDGQPQRTNVNGQDAIAVNLISPSPMTDQSGRQATERDMLVTVQRQDGSVLWLLFIAPEQDFQALSSTFQRMLQSLRVS